MFPIPVVDRIKTHILCSVNFPSRKSCPYWENVETYGRAGEATDANVIWRMSIACWIIKATDIH